MCSPSHIDHSEHGWGRSNQTYNNANVAATVHVCKNFLPMFAPKVCCLQLVPHWSKNVLAEFWKHDKISTMSNGALCTPLSFQ